MFFAGFITGFLIFGSIWAIILYYRHPIVQKIEEIEKKITLAGPRPKGFIFEPESEADEVRNNIIIKNKSQGKETKLSDLQ